MEQNQVVKYNTEATQTNLFPDCLTLPDGDHGFTQCPGSQGTWSQQDSQFLKHYVLFTYVSEAMKSGIQVAVREVPKPSH